MGKKCIPGLICIENMTLFMLIVIAVFLGYFLYQQQRQQKQSEQPAQQIIIVKESVNNLAEPPSNHMYQRREYTQIGILTRTQAKGDDLILPLMGRRIRSQKMQYYTLSNTGNVNAKLPISRNGKSCTGEYGCDEISNGDTVYVEGYSDTFKATVYENSQYNYMPNL
jgi:hypothetical protein